MRRQFIKVCPVPSEQQPINEYEELKTSWFFCLATSEKYLFLRNIIIIWSIGWLLSSPLAAASFPPDQSLLLFVVSSDLGAGVLLILILLQLTSGWYHIKGRLKKKTIFYEESGWYDGQTWIKPSEMVIRDRLIMSYQVNPIVNRLINTISLLSLVMFVHTMIWLYFSTA
ncbi:CGLD27 family protein [Candidatus Atelocyanobacterium thalassae]|uniref:Uncharacterized protein n=2 Tax=Candidatus Atelocyanobacterium thalassae TaxID=713887 RepID=A0A086CHD6_9CHRO|nr:CGLD27 family protein [Candidatus Atelocyanobacterium thalassa]KFF41600.1 MAG: Protein of unknown function (DUF1230) [Candidatus Atelocyanobacterium thalassa isolate SIO64986]BDA39313.1 hypothetical protein CPARK_000015200 [cyanobacterium endosymbiont of Braarudosphaera bigelowii]